MRSATRKRIGERCPTCGRKYPRAISAKRAKARRGPMRDPKYRAWCREQHCVACISSMGGLSSDDADLSVFGAVIDPAHTERNGQSSKGPDSSCVPLCRFHHELYDNKRQQFYELYQLDMKALAAEHYARYLQETGAK